MRRLLAVTALAFLAACGGKSNGSGILLSTTFSPNPPQRGSESILVALKNADGKPITGAMVKISSSMPSMSMTGPSAVARDNGDGTYRANITLQYATKWTFDITASANGKTASTEIKQDVK